MDHKQDALDTPLETGPIGRASNTATLSSKLDFGINVLFIAAWVVLGLGGLIDHGLLFLLALVHFFMGCYQFASTFTGAVRGQKPKFRYLFGAIGYLIFLAVVSALRKNDIVSEEVTYFFVGLIPFFGAVYYTKLCYDVMKNLKPAD